jgi:alpha-beta hydrolase superfamily lysophospholipase
MRPTLHFALTRDNWRLALHHFPGQGRARRHAVILCHGLGASHVGFDLGADASLARHLAQRGFHVFAVDLRGHGASERPSLFGKKRFGWSFDDYLLGDLPALFAQVSRLQGGDGVHFVGHSMGGLLLYAHLARGGSADVRSGTAIGSSLDYSASSSGFHRIRPLRPLLAGVPAVPIGVLARLSARAAGRLTTSFDRFNVWTTNVDADVWRQACRSVFCSVSSPVMAQLSTAMEPGGLRSRDGSLVYTDHLSTATSPILAIAGTRDPQCPPDAARRTLEAVGSARREFRAFGRAHGHADDYGHFDLLIGRRAHAEVFPCIDAWLEEHD